MSREEVKRTFFELLTEDKQFKQRLTKLILAAVAEKFVERFGHDVEPPKSEEVAQEKYSPEFIQKIAEHSGFDKFSDDKRIAKGERNKLLVDLDNGIFKNKINPQLL